MRILSNKGFLVVSALFIVLTIFIVVSSNALWDKITWLIALGLASSFFAVTLRAVGAQRKLLVSNRRKLDSIANSLHALHQKVERSEKMIIGNDIRGRKILQVSAENRDFSKLHIENGRELNYHLGVLLNEDS